MSIYSGFATRFQEEAYDHCIDSLLYVLQKRIIKFYQGQQADQQKFISVVVKLHHQMRHMEKSKYLEPKSSLSISELIKFMQIYEQNLCGENLYDPSILPDNHNTNQIQPPKIKDQKQKVSFWVEKGAKLQQNSQQLADQQISKQTSVIQQHLNERQIDKKAQFKRTNFNSNMIHLGKPKNPSRIHLSRDRQQGQLAAVQAKAQKNRSISGLLNEKQPTIYSKASFKQYPQEQSSTARRRKIKSINKSVNQIERQNFGVRNQVSDIIKDYIIKSKKSKKVFSRNSKYQLDYLGKLNDF